MNDIYEQKALKYKHKYLQLKAQIQYIGEGGGPRFEQLKEKGKQLKEKGKQLYNYLYEKMKTKQQKNRERYEKEAVKKAEEKRYEQIYINSFEKLDKDIQKIYYTEYARIKNYNDVNAIPDKYNPNDGQKETQITKETFLKNKKYCNEIEEQIYTDKDENDNIIEYKKYTCYTQQELNDRKEEEEKQRKIKNDKEQLEYDNIKKEEKNKEDKDRETKRNEDELERLKEKKRTENPFYIPYHNLHRHDHDKIKPYYDKQRFIRNEIISKLYNEKGINFLNEEYIKYKDIMIDVNPSNQKKYKLENKQLNYEEIMSLLDNEFDTRLPEQTLQTKFDWIQQAMNKAARFYQSPQLNRIVEENNQRKENDALLKQREEEIKIIIAKQEQELLKRIQEKKRDEAYSEEMAKRRANDPNYGHDHLAYLKGDYIPQQQPQQPQPQLLQPSAEDLAYYEEMKRKHPELYRLRAGPDGT